MVAAKHLLRGSVQCEAYSLLQLAFCISPFIVHRRLLSTKIISEQLGLSHAPCCISFFDIIHSHPWRLYLKE